MFQILILVPVLNDNTPVKEGLRRGRTLRARGMIRLDEMYIDQREQYKDAEREALRLAVITLKEKGYDTTVVGFRVKHRLENKPRWECTLQQVHEALARRKQAGLSIKVA